MWWIAAVFVVALVIAFAFMPKPQTQKPQSIEDVQVPTAEFGRDVSVLFGTKVLESPNTGWYGDFRSAPIIKKQ